MNAKSLIAVAALAVLAAPLITAAGSGPSNAANKTAAAGSTVEFLSPLAPATTILATTIKTSAPQDLILSVTAECALWTTVQTVGNDVSEARATVQVWVEFDGVPVPVSGSGDDGKVVFCDRLHRQTTTGFDDENATIKQYLATRTANGFNWLLPDAGSGVHTIEVKADLTSETTGTDALAQAGVGHRTLIVEPTHLAQGFTL
jgi:hypothetical protein